MKEKGKRDLGVLHDRRVKHHEAAPFSLDLCPGISARCLRDQELQTVDNAVTATAGNLPA